MGVFKPNSEEINVPTGSCCFKYGYSGSLKSRMETHLSGREYPDFKLHFIRKTETIEEAQQLENGLHALVDERGCRVSYNGHHECFVTTVDQAEQMILDAQCMPIHSEESPECEFCEAVLSNAGSLRRHQRTVKSCLVAQEKANSTAESPTQPDARQCKGCGKQFGRTDYYKKHIESCKARFRSIIAELEKDLQEARDPKPLECSLYERRIQDLEQDNERLRSERADLLQIVKDTWKRRRNTETTRE
jgi:hypothetical protein